MRCSSVCAEVADAPVSPCWSPVGRHGHSAIITSVNHCAVNVGRLVEIRANAGYRSADDVDVIFGLIGRELAKVPSSKRVVVVTDWRRCPIMSDAASERMLSMLTRSNPRVERSAALASPDSPLAVLQFMRLIRESKHPDRRLFNAALEACEWLAPVLTEAEQQRLRAFLELPVDATSET